MKVIMDLCIVPLGVGVSLSKYVAACEEVLNQPGLKTSLHPNGTSIEGEWDDVMAAVKACHEKVHGMGAPRIHTNIKWAHEPIGSSLLKIRFKALRIKWRNASLGISAALVCGCGAEAYPMKAERAAMVQTIRAKGFDDERILAATGRVNRHRYVPEAYRGPDAYGDHPCPIGHGQTIS